MTLQTQSLTPLTTGSRDRDTTSECSLCVQSSWPGTLAWRRTRARARTSRGPGCEGLMLPPPRTPAAGAQVAGGPPEEQPPSPETLQPLASVSPPGIRGQAHLGWGAARQPEPGMEGLSGMGGRVRRAGPGGGRGGLARVGRLRAGIPSGQSGLFSPLRKVVAVAGSESPGLLTASVLRAGGSEGGGPAASSSLSRLSAAAGSLGLARPPRPARTVTSPGRCCVSFALVRRSC